MVQPMAVSSVSFRIPFQTLPFSGQTLRFNFVLVRFVSFYFALAPSIESFIKGLRGFEKNKITIDSFPARAVPLRAMTAKLAAGAKGPDKERSPRRGIEQR